jgi:hypothetical protein
VSLFDNQIVQSHQTHSSSLLKLGSSNFSPSPLAIRLSYLFPYSVFKSFTSHAHATQDIAEACHLMQPWNLVVHPDAPNSEYVSHGCILDDICTYVDFKLHKKLGDGATTTHRIRKLKVYVPIIGNYYLQFMKPLS